MALTKVIAPVTKPDEEKFAMWAATVPYTLRNPHCIIGRI